MPHVVLLDAAWELAAFLIHVSIIFGVWLFGAAALNGRMVLVPGRVLMLVCRS